MHEMRYILGEKNYCIVMDGNVPKVFRLGMYNSQGKFYPTKRVKCSTDSDGYLVCHLNIDGKRSHHKLHRLVAQLYIPNPNNLPQVNHKDGDKTNNSPDNLEWCTAKENTIHAVKIGLRVAVSGDAHYKRRNKCELQLGI